MADAGFTASGYAWRLYCGHQVLESKLKEAVVRAKARRAFVICSPSISHRTDSIKRVSAALGDLYAGMFDRIENDATYASVASAADAASAAAADLLIAVGGGGVIMAARAVAIFMAEPGDPFEIMTQYPEGRPPYSPRLSAPKPPIFNIPVTPTSAMNRAGTALKNPDLDQRMEYFDPKTRPQALFLDEEVLAATPARVFRSTATTSFAGLIAAKAQINLNPLAAGDEEQAFRLSHRSYARLIDEPGDPAVLIDLTLAAFLLNRAEDDAGGGMLRGAPNPFSGDYAVSTALHIRYPRIGQGEASTAIQIPKIRLLNPIDAPAARRVAEALQIWRPDMDGREATLSVADHLEVLYRGAGMPTCLRDLDVPKEDLPAIAAETVKNFNANSRARSPDLQIREALLLLEAAF